MKQPQQQQPQQQQQPHHQQQQQQQQQHQQQQQQQQMQHLLLVEMEEEQQNDVIPLRKEKISNGTPASSVLALDAWTNTSKEPYCGLVLRSEGPKEIGAMAFLRPNNRRWGGTSLMARRLMENSSIVRKGKAHTENGTQA